MCAAENPRKYALVAYVRDPAGRFVEQLRRELHPDHTHLSAHITVLPPRKLSGCEADAIELLTQSLAGFDAFQVTMGGVETFAPVTPTIFIRVERWAHKLRDLHERLGHGLLEFEEQWPYMPHLTIVKMPDFEGAEFALEESRRRWSTYTGSRTAEVEELSFVRET